MRIGLLTGGGDCPGLNAVIRAVTKSLLGRCCSQVLGIHDGFAGLIEGRARPLDWESVSGIVARGGTILGTSNRANPLASAATTESALANARAWGLDAIVTVGGDGTQSIAHGLSAHGLAFVGVPKTIDNDIVGCEQSFGFDTAVATAAQALERISDTGHSHSRVMIVETMGRNAGWIALEAGLASAADVILLPEIDFDVSAIAAVCNARAQRQRFTVICIGEGAKPLGGTQTVALNASDPVQAVRLGGAGHALQRQLQPLVASEVRTTVLGHVQRGGSPTPFDRVLATQYGNRAAQLVQDGAFGQMVTYASGQLSTIAIGQVAHAQRTVPLEHPLLTTAREIGVSFGEPGRG